MSSDLFAHCDTKRVEEKVVKSIEAPEFTKTWHPVPHKDVISAMETCVKNAGLPIRERQYSLNGDGTNMFGVWKIGSVVGKTQVLPALGFRNSISKSFAIGVTSGTNIFVCDNMAFSGTFVEFRRHTSGLDYDELLEITCRAVNAVTEKTNEFSKWHEGLHEIEMTEDDTKIFTFESMKRDIIKPSKFNQFLTSLEEEKRAHKEATIFTFHGAHTRQFRGYNFFQMTDRNVKLNALVEEIIEYKKAA